MSTTNVSVSNLIRELETRIDMLSGVEVKANLDKTSFERLTTIINKYTKRAPKELTDNDISEFKKSDIEEILNIMEIKESEINKIIEDFKALKKKDSKERTKILSNIRKKIVEYISNFIDIDKAQNMIQNTKISEYQMYIDILRSESLETPFEDLEGLQKLMTSFAMSNEDKWNVLTFIAALNLSVVRDKTEEYNYASLIENMHQAYAIENEELVELIEKKLSKQEIDVELIPTYALEIAHETGYNTMLIQNIIVTIIAHNIYGNYQQDISEEEKERLKEILELTLNQQVSNDCFVIETTKEILSKNKSLYENIHIDVMIYIDLTISEIVEEGYTREAAIDLKTLPILKTMAETIDKLETLTAKDPNYAQCIKNLSDLNEAYESITSKLNRELTRK